MQIKISGKNIDIGDSLTEYTKKEITKLIDKYVGEEIESSIVISKDKKIFDVESCLHLHKGFAAKSGGTSEDPYKAVDLSIERLEGMIKKHKNRIKDKNRRMCWENNSITNATSYVLERKDSSSETDEEHIIIAESEKVILSLSVSEAVMKLDLTGNSVVMFKNSESGRVNIVYKRPDGHIGWVDYKA